MSKTALFWKKKKNNIVLCRLCPHKCLLNPNQSGICNVRKNLNGQLYSLVYGKIIAAHIDPIEKKPFYHFLPNQLTLSIACAGCNLSCNYCQNWEIAHPDKPESLSFIKTPAKEIVKQALDAKVKIIAFTYTEPTVWYEYMYDVAKLAKKNGLKNVIVSNGYISQKPLDQLLPLIDGVKIDLKSFNKKTYLKLCKAKLAPVLATLKTIKKTKTWLEIVSLIVPGWTDSKTEIKKMANWIIKNLGDQAPLHLLGFYPAYKMLNVSPTDKNTLIKIRKICLDAGLKYVYTGNINYPEGNNTYCPKNGKLLIQRQGFSVIKNLVGKTGKAKGCSVKIPGVWQ